MRKWLTGLWLAIFSASATALSDDLNIESASDGLHRIQRDSFGIVKLPILKRLAEKNRDISVEREFPAQTGSRRFHVHVDASGAEIGFYTEVPLENRAPDYDIDLGSVMQHVKTLDIGSAEGHKFSTTGLTWNWQASDFLCRLQYVDESYTSSLLSYECRYEKSARSTSTTLEGGALSHYLGVIACVDRSYFDGGYVPGEPAREELMNAMLKKLSLPAYDESLLETEAGDSDAYMQGYADCDDNYEFLATEAARLGIEADF